MKKITLFLIAIASSSITFGQAVKKVLVEDETGTWCGYCPRGRTVAEDIESSYPNAITVANHEGDTYQVTYSDAIDQAMNTYGYPGGMVDRKLYSGQSYVVMATNYWKSKTANQLLTIAPLGVSIFSTYNSSTRQANVTVYVNAYSAASGDMRINCVLVEDSIVNASDPQHNYMGNGCSSPDPTSPWYNYPCSITNYAQRDVVRTNLAPDWGTSGVIPASVSAGQSWSQSYSTTLPAGWNASHVSVVAFVANYNTSINSRDVINASKVLLGTSNATGIEEHPELPSVVAKQNSPNPFTSMTALSFTLNVTDNVKIKVYNQFGQVVNDLVDTKLIPGDHTFYWAGDDNNGNYVASGVYYYTITTSSMQVTKQMIYAGH